MFFFLLFYLAIIFSSSITLIIYDRIVRKQVKVFSIFISVLFVMLLTFRPEISPDTESYIQIYNTSSNVLKSIDGVSLMNKYGNSDYSVEYGYLLLCRLLHAIIPSYRFLFLFSAIITITVIPKALNSIVGKNDENGFVNNNEDILRLSYISTFGLLYSGVAIRAGLAISLGLFAVALSRKKRFVLSLVITLFAFAIQRSSIVFLFINLLVTLLGTNNSNYSNGIFLSMGLLGTVLLLPSFRLSLSKKTVVGFFSFLERMKIQDFYYGYFVGNNAVNVGFTKLLVCLLCCIMLLSFYVQRKKYPKCYSVVLIAPILIILFFSGARALSRFYDMFLIFVLPLLVMMQSENDGCGTNRVLHCFVVIVLMAISINTCFILGAD